MGRQPAAKQRKISAKQRSVLEANRWKPGQSGNPAGRPKGRLLSEAYRDLLSRPFPRDMKTEVNRLIDQGASVADVVALIAVSHVAKGSAPHLVEMRKATEGDTLRVADAKAEALKRMSELGLREEDVWKYDPALGEYLVSIGAIQPRDVANGADRGEGGESAGS